MLEENLVLFTFRHDQNCRGRSEDVHCRGTSVRRHHDVDAEIPKEVTSIERDMLRTVSSRELPAISKRLHTLAHNLWWSWNPRAQAIFQELSPLTWQSSNHNPVAVLSQFSEGELRAHLGDEVFCHRLLAVLDSFEAYMHMKFRDGRIDRSGTTKNALV